MECNVQNGPEPRVTRFSSYFSFRQGREAGAYFKAAENNKSKCIERYVAVLMPASPGQIQILAEFAPQLLSDAEGMLTCTWSLAPA
jgi:hypothetical protein